MPNLHEIDKHMRNLVNDLSRNLFKMGGTAGITGLSQVISETPTERRRRELEAKSAVGKLLYEKITPQPQIKK